MNTKEETVQKAIGPSSVDLPPEMLEMILKKLGQSDMLKSRLINSQWKEVVESLQEKKVLSNWLNWNATYMADRNLFPVLPIVKVKMGVDGVQLESLVYLPSSVEFKEGHNSFPNKSLCIEFRKKPKKGKAKLKKNDKLKKVAMDKFLVQHGHHLTSLALHETIVMPAQLLEIMTKLCNLKALTLHQIKLDYSNEDARKFLKEHPLVAASTKLTHLRVFFCDHGIIQWLVDAFSEQLVRLELDGTEILPLGEGCSNVCKKLEQLSVHQPNMDFFNNSGKMPLKYLSLIDVHKDVDPEETSVLKFVQNFSTTLEVLNLGPDFEIDYYCGDEDDEWKESAVVFPKLKRLSVRVQEYYDEYGKALIEILLPKFPNLEFLELQRFSWMLGWESDRTIRMHAVENINQFNYFQACPKLKTVAVTNLGRVRKREYYVTVDKQMYERLAPRVSSYMSESSSEYYDSSASSSSESLPRMLEFDSAASDSSSSSDSDVVVVRRKPGALQLARKFNVGSSSDSD